MRFKLQLLHAAIGGDREVEEEVAPPRESTVSRADMREQSRATSFSLPSSPHVDLSNSPFTAQAIIKDVRLLRNLLWHYCLHEVG